MSLSTNVSAQKTEENRLIPAAVGFNEQSHHEWELADMNLQMDLTLNASNAEDLEEELNMTLDEFQTLVDSVLAMVNNLETGDIHIFVGNKGKDDFGEEVAAIAPSIIIENDITVPKELLALSPDISDELAAELEFTLPTGSGISLVSPLGTVIAVSMISSPEKNLESLMRSSLVRLLPFLSGKTFSYPQAQSYYTAPSFSFPYPYNELTQGAFLAPIPLTNHTMLPTVGAQYKTLINEQEGFNANYTEDGDLGTFTASGENTTTEDETTVTVSLDELTSQYNLGNGILQEYTLDASLNVNDDYGNSMDASLTFSVDHTASESFNFGVETGDKIGFNVKANIANGFVDAINGTMQGAMASFLLMGGATTEDTLEFFLNSTDIELECVGEVFTGLGLAYNATVTTPNVTEKAQVFQHPFGLSMPYILPKWELQKAFFQTHAHLSNKVMPNFLNSEEFLYDIMGVDEGLSVDINNDYAVLEIDEGGSIHWVSLRNDIDVTLKFNETTSEIARFNYHITGNTWHTYSDNGFLTEMGISLTFSIKYDTNDDGNLDDETTEDYRIRITINRVENTSGEPDYDSTINPPDVTAEGAGWEDVTPYKEAEEEEDGATDLLGDRNTLYIGTGVGIVVLLLSVVHLVRKRKKSKLSVE